MSPWEFRWTGPPIQRGAIPGQGRSMRSSRVRCGTRWMPAIAPPRSNYPYLNGWFVGKFYTRRSHARWRQPSIGASALFRHVFPNSGDGRRNSCFFSGPFERAFGVPSCPGALPDSKPEAGCFTGARGDGGASRGAGRIPGRGLAAPHQSGRRMVAHRRPVPAEAGGESGSQARSVGGAALFSGRGARPPIRPEVGEPGRRRFPVEVV